MKHALAGLLALSFLCSNSALGAQPKPIRPFDAELIKYCKSKGKFTCEKGQPETFTEASEMKLLAACKDYYQSNHCEMVKDSLPAAKRDTVMKCDLNDLCKSVGAVNEIQCRIDGIKSQFTFSNLAIVGATSVAAGLLTGSLILDSTIMMSGVLVYEASEKEKSCNQDIKFKSMAVKIHNLSLLEGEKPLDVEGKDSAVLKMPCSEIQKFLATRLDTIVQKRAEAKRWSLDYKEAKMSPAAKALRESLQSSRCLNQVTIQENTCRTITGLITNATFGLVGGAAAAKYSLPKAQQPVEELSAAKNADRTAEAMKSFKKIDIEPVSVEHSFSVDRVKRTLAQSKLKMAKSKELRFEMIKAKDRLEKVQATLKDKYGRGNVDINDESYLKLISEKQDLESFIQKAQIDLGEKNPQIIGNRVYQLDSDEIQILKGSRGGEGGAEYREVVDPDHIAGEYQPTDNQITITSNSENVANTFRHEYSHARTYSKTGLFSTDTNGYIKGDPFLFEISYKSGKGNGSATDSYVSYQHGSEASAHRAGAKTAKVIGDHKVALENFNISNIMAARNITVLEQAQEQVRQQIKNGKSVVNPGWIPGSIKVSKFGITFNVKLKDGYTHTLTIKRPPEDLVGKKPDAAKIDQYIDFLIRAQQKVIQKNNEDIKLLEKITSK